LSDNEEIFLARFLYNFLGKNRVELEFRDLSLGSCDLFTTLAALLNLQSHAVFKIRFPEWRALQIKPAHLKNKKKRNESIISPSFFLGYLNKKQRQEETTRENERQKKSNNKLKRRRKKDTCM
jgi:TPP-dependent 2-oxoacid decarboxylase